MTEFALISIVNIVSQICKRDIIYILYVLSREIEDN